MLPAGPDSSHQVEQLGGSDKPKADALEPDGDALATNGISLFDERNPDNGWNDTTSIGRGALRHPRSPTRCCCRTGRWWRSAAAGATRRRRRERRRTSGRPRHSPDHRAVEPAQQGLAAGAAAARVRTYHSTAMLLPDGRVVSAGDDYSGLHRRRGRAQLHQGQRRRSSSRRTCSTATARRRAPSSGARPRSDLEPVGPPAGEGGARGSPRDPRRAGRRRRSPTRST